jgi:hypothetical protein
MTAEYRLQGRVSVDGAQAAEQIRKVGASMGDTRARLREVRAASIEASGELKKLRDAGQGGSEAAQKLGEQLRSLAAQEIAIRNGAKAAAPAMEELSRSQGEASRTAGDLAQSTASAGASIGRLRSTAERLGRSFTTALDPATSLDRGVQNVGNAAISTAAELARTAAFMGGPLGIAAVAAGTAIGSLAVSFLSSKLAAEDTSGAFEDQKTAAERLTEALKELDRTTGLSTQTAEEAARAALEKARATLADEIATRKQIKAQLELNEAQREGLELALRRGGFAGAGASGFARADNERRRRPLAEQLAEQDAKISAAQSAVDKGGRQVAAFEIGRNVEARLSAVTAATRAYEAEQARLNRAFLAGEISAGQLDAGLEAARRSLDAAKDAARKTGDAVSRAGKALDTAARDAARLTAENDRLVRAFAPLTAAARDYEKALGDIRLAEERGLISSAEAATARFRAAAAEEQARRRDTQERLADGGSTLLSPVSLVRFNMEEELRKAGLSTGREVARGFRERGLTEAVAIGQVIGGQLGAIISTIGGLIQGAQTGNFTGVGGQLGGALTLLAQGRRGTDGGGAFGEGFREVFTDPINRLVGTLGNAFGANSDFAKSIGRAAGGAATGAAVAEIGGALGIDLNRGGSVAGGAIGGAVGSIFGPIGGQIGSLLGSLAGGLLGVKSGSTTVSSSGDGNISQSGSGSAAVQRATAGLGNTISDTIQSIADALGAEVGAFSVSIGKRGSSFRVDTSGQGRIRGSTVTATKDEREALSLAVADAIRDGAIRVSPRVQSALGRYADNVNKAVAEALKVKGLEDLLANQSNPFSSLFRDLEITLRDRVRVARDYGFDVLEIERINAQDREKLLRDTLARTTSSVRQLLDDLTFGSRATGSINERLAGLTAERDRVAALARGGDTSQLDALASLISQIDNLQREAFGSTAPAAAGRQESVALLNELISSTETRIREAADAARSGTDTTNSLLGEANASLDELVLAMREQNSLLGGFIGFFGTGQEADFNLSAQFFR